MNYLVELFIGRSRTVVLMLLFLVSSGLYSWLVIPKEADPDIAIPIIYVVMNYEGVSPEDAETMLIRPMEKQLMGIDGVKEMRAKATEGSASVTLEFEAGFDQSKALADVRAKVDLAKPDLPEDADEPSVHELSFSQFPVLIVGLSGDISEHELITLGRRLKDEIEGITEVLEVDMRGDREEVVEILIEPNTIDNYNLVFDEVLPLVSRNNRLVAAGNLDVGGGRVPVKVPGLFKHVEDILKTPIKVEGDSVILFSDIAEIQKTFKDPSSFARINGEPTLGLSIVKRSGENLIETVDSVKEVIHQEQLNWPKEVSVAYLQDQSDKIRDMLKDLQNNLISAVILVMVVVMGALGWRSSLLVGIAIPGSFLAGIWLLYLMGFTVSVVVLFALILSVGMLVDGAVIVTELADRKMAEGMHRKEAYLLAAQRMSLPVLSATATTLSAFMPLLFWPGIVGEFMKYLPITLICTLGASLFMAIIFIPTLGSIFGRAGRVDQETLKHLSASEGGDFHHLRGFTGWYVRFLTKALNAPLKVLGIACVGLLTVYGLYISLGKGIEFFPNVEPERVMVHVRMRGDLSIDQMNQVSLEVEDKLNDIEGFDSVYAQAFVASGGHDIGEDVHSIFQIELKDWKERSKARYIIEDIEAKFKNASGYLVEVKKEEAGPPSGGSPIQIEVSSRYTDQTEDIVNLMLAKLANIEGLKDISDSRPPAGIEWQVKVDRAKASLFGADVRLVGDMVQFVTNGLVLANFRPEFTDEEVDIIVRYPKKYRNLETIDKLLVNTQYGYTPVSYFVSSYAAPKVGKINRTDRKRVITVMADVKEGFLVNDKVLEIKKWLSLESIVPPSVHLSFKGENQDQEESQAFLFQAFTVALFLMGIILVTQFNSFYQAGLVLTAVIFSTIGVLLGLLVTGYPFSIVMNGIGVIALAGIVVNNNIVLIDAYNHIHSSKMNVIDAVLRTCAQRLRPILLTTVTTVLGLLPMVFKLNIDFLPFDEGDRFMTIGAPSTQMWCQLATSVAFGLAFSTLLTLVLTPALLVLGESLNQKIKEWRVR